MTAGTGRVAWGPVVTYLAVAFGGAWLVASPLWLSGRGLATPGAGLFLVAMMVMPSLATLVVTRLRPGTALATGLRAPGGIRPWLGWAALAWLAPLVLAGLALALSAAAGTFTADWTGHSLLAGTVHAPVPIGILVLVQILQVPLLGWLNVVPALGEEWGWRGWLLPALLPLGRWPAVLAVGVGWGLWHAPILLLGYNYPLQPPAVRILLMIGFCVVTGTLLGWLRLRTGSVWPAAIGHGFVNAVAGLPVLFAAAGHTIDNARVGLLGWPGWLVMAAAFGVVALLLRGRHHQRPGDHPVVITDSSA